MFIDSEKIIDSVVATIDTVKPIVKNKPMKTYEMNLDRQRKQHGRKKILKQNYYKKKKHTINRYQHKYRMLRKTQLKHRRKLIHFPRSAEVQQPLMERRDYGMNQLDKNFGGFHVKQY